MKLKLIYGRAGVGKSQYCFNQVAKYIEEKENITVITPEQFSFTAEKKLMDAINSQAVLNAEVVTFNRMAYRVMQEIGRNNKIDISKSGMAMLVYSILNKEKKNMRFLGKSDENIDIAITAIKELKQHAITVDMLEKEILNSQNSFLRSKLNDINIIYKGFENQIKGKYIDETDLLTFLAQNITKTEILKNQIIYIDEFAGYTEQEYEIIKQILKVAKEVNITVCTDELESNKNISNDIFYSNKITVRKLIEKAKGIGAEIEEINLNDSYRFKNNELIHIEKNIYNMPYERFKEVPQNVKVFLAKNEYSEIENVAKQIVILTKKHGYRYKDIGIITRNIETYSSLARAIFKKYEIPVFIDENRDLNQNILIQYILSIFDIWNKNFSYESVFNYIKTGFLNIDEYDIFRLENYCVKYGINYNKWKKDFVYYNENEEEINNLNEIRKEIIEPIIKLKKKIDENRTAENITKLLYSFLIEQKIDYRLKEKIEMLEKLDLIDLQNEYKNSFKVLVNILDEIVMIFKDDQMTLEQYAQILKIGFKNSGLNKIPGTQDQVIMGDIERSRSHKIKALFIIGINDGIFPSVQREEGFLNDEDREYLKLQGIELAKGTTENLYEENFNIYKAFTTAEEKLYLSYDSANSDGKSLRPSSLILKLKKIFPKLQEESDIVSEKFEITNEEATYGEMIKQIAKMYKGEKIEDVWHLIYKYYNSNEKFNRKLNKDLKALTYKIEPEKLNEDNINKLYGKNLKTSISKLERYKSCPFSYYLQYGLNLKEKEELKIQTLNTGTFMHEVIDEFFEKIKELKQSPRNITEEDLKLIVNDIVEEKLGQTKNYIFSSSEKYKLLVIRLKKIICKALKYILLTLVNSEFTVEGTEIEFGEKGRYKPIKLKLDDGKNVEIIGKIDRLDIAKNEDGKYIRIIDYKSSIKDIDLNNVYAGLQLQLLTYMDAVCKAEDFLPAGILYFSVLEQIIKSDKNMSEEEIENKIRAKFKMKGLILADIKVVKMHDKNIQEGKASDIIPAFIDKSGELSPKKTNGVTQKQFSDLQKYIDKILKQIVKEIYSGKVDIKPYYKKGGITNTPCSYCKYGSVCGFNYGICKKEYNFIPNYTKEEIFNKIKEEK